MFFFRALLCLPWFTKFPLAFVPVYQWLQFPMAPTYDSGATYDSGLRYADGPVVPVVTTQKKKGRIMATNAVPEIQDDLLTLAEDMADGLHTDGAGVGIAQNTEAVMRATITALRTAEAEFGAAKEARQAAVNGLQAADDQARDTALRNLRKRVRDLINELDTLLADNDARWHAFGLSMPADPDTPEPVESLTLTPGTAGVIVASWPRAVRATRYRPFVQIVGVDTEFVARDAVHDMTVNLTGFTTGQTVKVYIVAANDAGEAQPGPTEQILVP